MKVLFLGSGQFALEVFKVLSSTEFEIVAVISQKDKPVGRKKIITPTMLAQFVETTDLNLFKAESSTEILSIITEQKLEFDYLLVADYGVILSAELLSSPKINSLNVHGSLLPKYRGASPVHAALLANDTVTGVSIITMVEKLDAGPIWACQELPIDPTDDYESLLIKLGKLGGELLVRVLNTELIPIDQNESMATYAGKISKSDAEIDIFNIEFYSLVGKYKAYKKWPGIFFIHKELRIQILLIDYEVYGDKISSKPSVLIQEGMLVLDYKAAKIFVKSIKPAGKNDMLVSDFLKSRQGFFE